MESATTEGVSEYIGTGPYKVAEWKQDQYVKLEAFEDYQPSEGEASGLAGKKEAATQTIYYDVVTDASTRIAGVQSGEYDVAEEIPIDNYEDLTDDSALTLNVDRGGTLNLFLNTTEGVMANQTFRQAALAALNCDDIMLAAKKQKSF